MVISVFPDYGQAIDRYRSTRAERLERQAQDAQQAAYNRMLAGVPKDQRPMYEVLGPEQGVAMMLQNQQGQSERMAEARQAQLSFLQEEGQRFAEARAAQGDTFDEGGFLRDSVIRASDAGIPLRDPQSLQERVRTWGQGYTVASGDQGDSEFERVLEGLSPEEQANLRRERARYLAGVSSRPSSGGGAMFEYTDPNTGATIRYGTGGQLPPGAGTRAPGMGPNTASASDRTISALDESNVRAGPVDEYFRLTGQLTESGSGGAGAGARLIQEAGAQLGGGVALAEFLTTGDANLGPSIIARGNEILQEVTGLDAADTARLRSNQILVRSKLLPLVAGGMGQRFTDFENRLADEVLGDVSDPRTAFETMQGNRSAVFGALAVQDARGALAADRVPSFNVVMPNGQPNPDTAREMMRVLTQDYNFSRDDAYEIYEGYHRSLSQLYERPRRQLVEDFDAIQRAQQELIQE